jgi:integrase
MKHKLTTRQVDAIQKVGRHSDGHGLYLKVAVSTKTNKATKSWILRWGAQGVNTMGLGAYPLVSLASAREKARNMHLLLDNGIDPREERDRLKAEKTLARASSITFKEASSQYISKHSPKWSNYKHEQQWRNTLETYAFPIIENIQCSKIQKEHVLQILEPIWLTKNETASRLRGRIESILDWSIAKGYRKDENPALLRGNLKHLLPPISKRMRVTHYAAMAYTELPKFIAQLRLDQSISAKALLVCILTATRTSEITKATWDEFNLEKKIWTIPKHRMKAKIEHRVSLSNQVCELLTQLQSKGNLWVFTSPSSRKGNPISNMAMLKYLQRKVGCEKLTVHGFRSTFRDWAGEVARFPQEVCEHALAHRLKDQTEAAYQRGDYFAHRVELMERWADYCFNSSSKYGLPDPQ